MSPPTARPAFSVIIPLEFHRGTADECVRAWTSQVDLPRSAYEILLAAPAGFSESDLTALQALLGRGDRVLRFSERHDVPLCAAAARVARGEAFFFTESHCVPAPDVLAISVRALADNPRWSGFSVASHRVVHNPLSVIEADLYEADIARGMMPGHWCKILDQCFVTRREPYFAAGGFDPTLGHFAEWLLAARSHRMGLEIGYVPEGRIHHVYVGDLAEWRTFTRDFVAGEITALARGDADGFTDLFGFVPEWAARESWNTTTARRLLRVCWDDAQHGRRSRRDAAADLARWLPAALGANRLRMMRATLNDRWAERRARRALSRPPVGTPHQCIPPLRTESRRDALRASMGALAHAERLRAIARAPSRAPKPAPATGAWEPPRDVSVPSAGLFAPETHGPVTFAWSEPSGMVTLPIAVGTHELLVEWWADAVPRPKSAPRFYLNEQPIAASVDSDQGRARFTIAITDAAHTRLAWVGRGHAAPAGLRRRGLPLQRISWRPAR